MKVLVLGASGMLGHRIWINLKNMGVDAVGVARADLSFLDLPFIRTDEVDGQSLRKIFKEQKPDVVVNAVGVTKQADGITDYKKTIFLNSVLPHTLSFLAEEFDFRLIQLSTDCVFKGDIEGAYTDDVKPDSMDLYGASKAVGEIADSPNTLTLRISSLGRELSGHRGLLDWFLSQKGKTISGFKHAIFSGLPTAEVAEVIYKHVLPNKDLKGLYNLSVDPISKFDLLVMIKKQMNFDVTIEENTGFSMNRALNSDKFRALVGYKPTKWEDLVSKLHLEDPLYERLGK